MLRAWLLSIVLAAAPLGALAVMEAQDPGTPQGVALSEDGRTLTVDHRALPGPQGWFLLPFSAEAGTDVAVKLWANISESRDQTKGYAMVLDLGAQWEPLVIFEDVQGHRPWAAGAHNGTAVTCCHGLDDALRPRYVDGPQGTAFQTHIEPGDTLHVGLAADRWGQDDDLHVQIQASEADLVPHDLRKGTATHAIDLRQAAYANGTNVRLGGNQLAGEPGEAHLSLSTGAGTLAVVESWVSGNATAKLRMTLPNGTVVDNGDGRETVLFARGVTGPGTLSLSLTDVHEGAWGPLGDHEDWGWVDALALVSEMPLPQRDLTVHAGSFLDDEDEPFPEENTVAVNGTHMPGETGWFLAPITADADGSVEVRFEVEVETVGGEPTGFAPLVLPPQDAHRYLWGHVLPARPVVGAAVDGHGASCCPLPGNVSFSASSGTGELGVHLAAGETLYVGLAADGWGPGSSFTLQAHGNGTNVTLGEVVSGTGVRAVDLVQEAYRQGASVQVLGSEAQGTPGRAEIIFTAQHTGLVLAEHWITGDARGVLEVELPDGTVVDNGDGRNVFGHLAAFTDPGAFRLSLQDVQRPLPLPGAAGGEQSSLTAYALLVDLEVPHRGMVHYQDAAR